MQRRGFGLLHSLWLTPSRGISTSKILRLNYYSALGISKSSTQNEIKAAYYKLSMIYHPDKNQGSDSAAKKFREITQAYEILGNYRLRRLYDKGILHTADPQYAQHAHTVDEDLRPTGSGGVGSYEDDDAETKFYKSRFKKSKVADSEGRTPIYDFDEWARAHYGKSFDRRQAAKEKYDRIEYQKMAHAKSKQNDIVMISFIFTCVLIYFMFMAESSYDTPKHRAEARHAAMQAEQQQQKQIQQELAKEAAANGRS